MIAYIVSMGAGLEAFIYREVEALCEEGRRIKLYATKFRPGDIYAPKADWSYLAFSKAGILLRAPVTALKMLMRPRLLLEAIRDGGLVDLVFATMFVGDMKRSGVDRIHCHFGDHKFFIGYYCKRILGLPLSVTIHAHEFYTNPNENLFRKALAESDRVFPIAQKWVDRLVEDYEVAPEKIRLNRLFVDTDENSPSDEILILAVGRYTERKGFTYLLDALKELGDTNVRVLFIGFGELDLDAEAEKRGVRDKVTVFGKMNQEQLRVFYRHADILCVPSITTEREGAEGIPVVLMEGMACGLPVVATPCGAIEELVENIIVPERDAESLAKALKHLVESPELRKEQGARNRNLVKERFSRDNVTRFGAWLDEL